MTSVVYALMAFTFDIAAFFALLDLTSWPAPCHSRFHIHAPMLRLHHMQLALLTLIRKGQFIFRPRPRPHIDDYGIFPNQTDFDFRQQMCRTVQCTVRYNNNYSVLFFHYCQKISSFIIKLNFLDHCAMHMQYT